MGIQQSDGEGSSTLLNTIFVLNDNGKMRLTDVAEALGAAKSTAHYHLDTLQDQGLVIREGTEYKLSLTLLRFGLQARNRIPLFEAAKEEVDKLASMTKELGILSVEQRGFMIYLYKSGGTEALDIDAPLGGAAPLHNRAMGKAMLSNYPEDRVDDILDRRGLEKTAAETITDRGELKDELAGIAKSGIAFNRQESLDGINGVGVPITDDRGDILGAMSVAGPAERLTGEKFTERCPDLLSKARNVVELNYRHKRSE